MRSSRTLMVQGTTSDAGKSTLVAALCRLLHRRSIRVAPFKPQNMALNSAVASDGGEIGRAQALQAEAAGVPPIVDMNPVLLKPSSDTTAQVIIHGRVRSEMSARDYHDYKTVALTAVIESYERLKERFDFVVVEGAGSPAEVNLRDRDIANMGFAEAVDCPVVLVADIDRGGVFAQIIGTLECLSLTEQRRIVGFIINRFRGDRTLLDDGVAWLEERTGKPVFGVVPYLGGLNLDAEDAIATQQNPASEGSQLRIAIPVFPRISNHTDFDALRAHPNVDVTFVGPGMALPPCDLVILPGTKNTRVDLEWLIDQGCASAIKRHVRYGGKIIGICGGMQMLGAAIHDPDGVEGPPGSSSALGFLDFETIMNPQKVLTRVEGELLIGAGAHVSGYEIHMGHSDGPAMQRPAIRIGQRVEGAVSEDGQVFGTYLHGIFDRADACSALLRWAGIAADSAPDYSLLRSRSIDRLADAVERYVDVERLLRSAGGILQPPISSQPCSRCGEAFTCGGRQGASDCWCSNLPAVMPLPAAGVTCLCPRCLEADIAALVRL